MPFMLPTKIFTLFSSWNAPARHASSFIVSKKDLPFRGIAVDLLTTLLGSFAAACWIDKLSRRIKGHTRNRSPTDGNASCSFSISITFRQWQSMTTRRHPLFTTFWPTFSSTKEDLVERTSFQQCRRLQSSSHYCHRIQAEAWSLPDLCSSSCGYLGKYAVHRKITQLDIHLLIDIISQAQAVNASHMSVHLTTSRIRHFIVILLVPNFHRVIAARDGIMGTTNEGRDRRILFEKKEFEQRKKGAKRE